MRRSRRLPKVQAQEVIEPPSGSDEVEASKETGLSGPWSGPW